MKIIIVFCLLMATNPAYSYVRKNRQNIWLHKKMDSEVLVPSLKAGADYLVRTQLDSGDFIYVKDPLGKCSKQTGKYSIIRHLGAVYGLLRSYEITKDARYLNAGKKGIDFVVKFLARNKGFLYIKGMGRPSLGENGFFLINLALYEKLTGLEEYKVFSKEISRFLKKYLVYNGKYTTSGQWAECQAIIGLVFYYKFINKDKNIPPVIKNFLQQMIDNGKYSHWSVQAVDWYLNITGMKNKEFISYGINTGKHLLENIWTARDTKDSRYIGSKNGKFGSCGASARNEGLISAYKIAHLTGHKKEARLFLKRIKEHLAYVLQFQYNLRGNLLAYKYDAARTARLFDMKGGIFNTPKTYCVRIDFVAHHLRAIAAYLKL